MIKPENLVNEDVNEEAIINKFNEIFETNKIRDILKGAVIKSDSSVTYTILGIENQSEIHYAMPVRNALYDALNYSAQVTAKTKENRKKKKLKDKLIRIRGDFKRRKLKCKDFTIISNELLPS